MQITVNIPDELAVEAQKRGVGLESSVAEFLTQRLRTLPQAVPGRSASEAVETILSIQKRNKLGGLKIEDLINEGRK